MSECVGTIKSKDGKIVYVRINDFRGKTYVDIRHFFQGTSDMIPSKKGISIEAGMLSDLISVLEGVEQRLAKGQNENKKSDKGNSVP